MNPLVFNRTVAKVDFSCQYYKGSEFQVRNYNMLLISVPGIM